MDAARVRAGIRDPLAHSMKLAHDPSIDTLADPVQASHRLASWYAPGLSDELGDRLLMFDNSSAPSLELLRFRPTLTASPGFEVALRRRVERLSHFRHPSFATVRAVEYLGDGEGLALLSNHTPGKRLSDVLQDARGPAFATALIQQLTPALDDLREYGEGSGHGALAPSRIVVTPEGRLMILEHVLGPALERLQYSTSRLRTELGIAVPPAATAHDRLDSRTDYFQLGLIALSLLLGRRLSPDESQENIAALLAQAARTADRESPGLFRGLRVWLERALQLDGHVFETSEDAQDALYELPVAGAVQSALQLQSRGTDSARADAGIVSPTAVELPTTPVQDVTALDRGVAEPESLSDTGSSVPLVDLIEPTEVPVYPEPTDFEPEQPYRDPEPPVRLRQPDQHEPTPSAAPRGGERLAPTLVVSRQEPQAPGPGRAVPVDLGSREIWPNVGAPAASAPISESRPSMDHARVTRRKPPPQRRLSAVQLLVAVLLLCVIGEGFVIATLMQRRATGAPAAIVVETLAPGADVLVNGRSAGVTPLEVNVGADTRSIRVLDPRRQALDERMPPPEPPRAAPARQGVGTAGVVSAAPQRSGGIRLFSPIEVEVFEGNRRLGSSATGIVSASAGRHELELLNSLLGYRTRQTVDVRAGQVVSLQVTPPNGRMSINAVPWAEVWIGGRSVGETPLGNVSVPLGEHEIIFRHPKLGDQRQTAIVRLDAVTRVSANLQR